MPSICVADKLDRLASVRLRTLPPSRYPSRSKIAGGELGQQASELLVDAGLEVTAIEGIAFSPLKGLHLSENTALNYILAARHSGRV